MECYTSRKLLTVTWFRVMTRGMNNVGILRVLGGLGALAGLSVQVAGLGATGRATCKRQAIGSNPITGSQVGGRLNGS
jgi:hypothetical protein